MSLPTIKAACGYFGITEDTFFGQRRFHEIIRARAAVVYVMRERDQMSYPQIGKRIGGRDHSTIIHAMKRASAWMMEDDEFSAFVTAQMELPKYSPRAVIMRLVANDPPPPPVLSKPVLPPCPAHLVRVRSETKKQFHRVGMGARSFEVDDDGVSREEHYMAKRLIRGSKALIEALRAEHPERFVA